MPTTTTVETKPNLKTKPSLTLKRHFKATPEALFSAWTNPEKIAHWFGPPNIESVEAEADARMGGTYRIFMRSKDGEEHDVRGVYRKVVPNEQLVFTWAWQSTPERESLVTILIKAERDGALLTLTHEYFFDETARDNHNKGWTACLDALETYLA